MNGRTKSKACLIISIFLLGMTCTAAAGRTIYVDADGPADFNTIQAAINDAIDGDTIIVAEGKYFENINFNGRNITLTSTDPCNPEVVAATIIDGNQNGSVVTFKSEEDANSVLAGFTIRNGYADVGGGILCRGPLPPHPMPIPPSEYNCPGPTITNCIISNNSANAGGGMCNIDSSPALTDCTFTNNSAVVSRGWGDGGGMRNIRSSPTLTNCTFNENSAASGGGMRNEAYLTTGRQSNPILTNCTFNGNSAGVGGGMSSTGSSPTLTNCIFSGNSARYGGGGMANGSLLNIVSNPTLTNCTFNGNSAQYDGGGMYNHGSNPTLTNCTFTNNSAVGRGMWEGYGGGIFNFESSQRMTNCILSGNWAKRGGGGIYVSVGSYGPAPFCIMNNPCNVTLINCTFAENLAQEGRALVCTSCGNQFPSNIQITSSILFDGGDEIRNYDNSTIMITYSNVEGGWPGEGNIDFEPLFVDPGYWDPNGTPKDANDDVWVDGDYHLLPDSACINAGDPNYVAEPNETDLDGRPRVIGGRIDMGAYEYSPPIQANVRIVPRTISLASSGKWIAASLLLPEDYNVTDIDPNGIFLENEIEPERFWLSEDNQIALIKFDREQVQNILSVGQIELTITGRLIDGQLFEATDIIKVIDKSGEKPAKKKK